MAKLINLGTQDQKSLVECLPKGEPEDLLDLDPTYTCEQPTPQELFDDIGNKKIHIGRPANADPITKGKLINDVGDSDRTTIYRYTKSVRGCNEAVKALFKDIIVLDEDNKAHTVPIIWATQEEAVGVILQDNIRKDNSLVVDRIKLPMMAIYSNEISFSRERYVYHKALSYLQFLRNDGKPGTTIKEKYDRDTVFGFSRPLPIDINYTLYVWTLYGEDMDQIVEQIMPRVSPAGYVQVRGIDLEIPVALQSIGNNLNLEPGNMKRVIKYQFNLKAETYISQPITRNKAVLKIKTDFFNSVDPEMISDVIDRIEVATEELKNND